MRRLLLATLAAGLSVSLFGQGASSGPQGGAVPARDPQSGLPASLAAMRDYRPMRVSSEDRPGNGDMRRIEPKQTLTLAELEGPGEITHLWTTIATRDTMHLRNIVIRIYWDGLDKPSVECPIGDFYGLGHGKYYYFNNPVQAIGTMNGMNCFWPMPFAKSAKITATNEGDQPTDAFYYYVDWRKYQTMPEKLGYFHAQYRQAFPNENGKPYLILETEGTAGHFVGVSLSILTQVAGWWGEGDDIFTIDGEARPSLWGTGSEDYFCGAWCYGKTFFTNYFGMPLREKDDQSANNYWNVYRLHLESPIAFTKSLKVEIEHGAAGFDETRSGGRNNDYASVAYYYLASPQPVGGPLPEAAKRIPLFRNPDVSQGIYEPQFMAMSTVPAGLDVTSQEMGAFKREGAEWLNNDQMFCRGKKGDVVKLEFEMTDAKKGALTLQMSKAPDYGRVQIKLNGKTIVQSFDGFASQVGTASVAVGSAELPKGKNTLEITTLGKNPKSKNTYWGVDYLKVGGQSPQKVTSDEVVKAKSGKRGSGRKAARPE